MLICVNINAHRQITYGVQVCFVLSVLAIKPEKKVNQSMDSHENTEYGVLR